MLQQPSRGVRILQRRQRLGIERAGGRRVNQVLFLRDGRTRSGEHEDGEQASGSAASATLLIDLCRIRGAVGNGVRPASIRRRTRDYANKDP